jgi:hypothetical protein
VCSPWQLAEAVSCHTLCAASQRRPVQQQRALNVSACCKQALNTAATGQRLADCSGADARPTRRRPRLLPPTEAAHPVRLANRHHQSTLPCMASA